MRRSLSCFSLLLVMVLCACSAAPATTITYDPTTLRFSGERALEIETDFVQRFPNRSSGQDNNRLAAEWLQDEFTRLGLTCSLDQWQVVNYSRGVHFQNVICKLPGITSQEILLAAHLDQSPGTVQGADNDGSGMAILLHLAEIFSGEAPPEYTIVFLSTDGEEYGQLGARRYVTTHADISQIIAGISLDNLGNDFYTGLDIDSRGQFRRYGALWIQRVAQEAARAAGDLWVPGIVPPFDQVLSQAVPISFVDDGPMISAGIAAINFGGHVPPGSGPYYWSLYHSPNDTLDNQSVISLYNAGRVTEAVIRQLLSMPTFPVESGPYLYFAANQAVLHGVPLWSIFAVLVALFFFEAGVVGRKELRQGLKNWHAPLVHFLSLWLPLLGSILLLYLFVAVGLMDSYALYPATTKDPALTTVKWTAVVLWIASLVVLLALGRWIARRVTKDASIVSWARFKSLAFLVVGLGAVYIAVTNPFSLLFIVPLLFWFLISGRHGAWKLIDLIFFLLGGLIVYVLFYFFGYLVLHINLYVLWFLLMMFSIRMVSFPAALVITAILAAGLMLVVNPARGKVQPGLTADEPKPVQ